MTLRDYLAIAKRWWWLVLAGCLLAGGSAYFLTARMTPIYSAQSTILVNQIQDASGITYQDILGSQSLTKTYAQLVTSTTNLQSAVDQLGDPSVSLGTMGGAISASDVTDTQLIHISAQDPSPARAARMANAVAEAFPGYIRNAQFAGTSDGKVINTVFVAERATAPSAPVRPNKMLNTVMGLFLGLVVMLGAVALLEYLDEDIDDAQDIEALDLPFLGNVVRASRPRGTSAKEWVPSILRGGFGAMAESYRQVQANLSFSLKASGASILLVTSASPGEGKTTTAANLATVLSQSSQRVLLIDGDLRKPDIHRFFSLPNGPGLSAAFLAEPQQAPSFALRIKPQQRSTAGTTPPQTAAFATQMTDTFAVLTSGPVPPNPPELIASKQMAAIIKVLAAQWDVVVIDSPPVLALADTTLWLAMASGVVIVAREGKTRRGPLSAAAAAVKASNVPILGVILNASNPKHGGSYYYHDGYYKAGRAEET